MQTDSTVVNEVAVVDPLLHLCIFLNLRVLSCLPGLVNFNISAHSMVLIFASKNCKRYAKSDSFPSLFLLHFIRMTWGSILKVRGVKITPYVSPLIHSASRLLMCILTLSLIIFNLERLPHMLSASRVSKHCIR